MTGPFDFCCDWIFSAREVAAGFPMPPLASCHLPPPDPSTNNEGHQMTELFFAFSAIKAHRPMRRRFIERLLKRLGVSRRKATTIASRWVL